MNTFISHLIFVFYLLPLISPLNLLLCTSLHTSFHPFSVCSYLRFVFGICFKKSLVQTFHEKLLKNIVRNWQFSKQEFNRIKLKVQTHIPILTWAVPSRWRGADLAEEQLCALILPDCRYLSKKSASLWEHETPNMEIQKIHTGIWNYTGISLFSSLAIANKICFFPFYIFITKNTFHVHEVRPRPQIWSLSSQQLYYMQLFIFRRL